MDNEAFGGGAPGQRRGVERHQFGRVAAAPQPAQQQQHLLLAAPPLRRKVNVQRFHDPPPLARARSFEYFRKT
jgi:hypothetical protein